MRLLRGLRILKRHGGIGEIGAGILFVGIEEEVVELGREVIVMGDVAPRAACRVELAQAPHHEAHAMRRNQPGGRVGSCRVRDRQPEEPMQVVIVDRDRAVGIAFAQGQFGVGDQPSDHGLVSDAQDHGRSRAVTGLQDFSPRQVHGQGAVSHHGIKHSGKQRPPHGSPPSAPPRRFWRTCLRHRASLHRHLRSVILFLNRYFVKISRRSGSRH